LFICSAAAAAHCPASFDNAEVYAKGKAEEIMGQAFKVSTAEQQAQACAHICRRLMHGGKKLSNAYAIHEAMHEAMNGAMHEALHRAVAEGKREMQAAGDSWQWLGLTLYNAVQ
jgi:hypothetical protein